MKEITEDYVKDVCKMGQFEKTCVYLLLGENGFECAKTDQELKQGIDARKTTMVAQGDNCE